MSLRDTDGDILILNAKPYLFLNHFARGYTKVLNWWVEEKRRNRSGGDGAALIAAGTYYCVELPARDFWKRTGGARLRPKYTHDDGVLSDVKLTVEPVR